MNLEKLNPWNWFKHEDEQHGRLPVERAEHLPRSRLHHEIDRMFDEFFEGFGSPLLARSGTASLLRPQLDIEERDKEYRISVELPGVSLEDVELTVQNRILLIRGEKRFESEERQKNFHRVERSYGSFQRSLSLPEDADPDDIEAKFADGVLRVTIKRKARAASNARRIAIGH